MSDVPDLVLRIDEIVITEKIAIVTEIVIVNEIGIVEEIVIVEELRIEVVKERDNLRIVHGSVLRMVTAEMNFSSATRSKYRVTQWKTCEEQQQHQA